MGHLKLVARPHDRARVRLLAAGFRVEGRLGEDDLGEVSRMGGGHAAPLDDDAEHGRLGVELLVAEELRLAVRAELAVDGDVGQHCLLRLSVGLGA